MCIHMDDVEYEYKYNGMMLHVHTYGLMLGVHTHGMMLSVHRHRMLLSNKR